ncbi:MAG: ATP-dependent endonuclease [Candidatus Gastranaerophilales bacterium]|nr:ATP-dependent endonuclease [Candidatus Gastranaerophilales bacterium]
MKFKKLTKSQIIISLDRLTRFKPVEEKYLRVFCDIILSNIQKPVLKKSDLINMDYRKIRDIAVEIFNSSLENRQSDLTINYRLKEYENKTFNNSKEVQYLLENKLNYKSAIELVNQDDVINLQWLKHLASDKPLPVLREENDLLYPIEKVVIAEGITEEILLPEFAKYCGYDFIKNGVKVLAAGGKNQVVKLYYKLADELKIPIFVLLDNDAKSNGELINARLRNIDRVYLLSGGEFEDILPKNLIKKTINSEFKNFVTVTTADFTDEQPTVKQLEEIFKEKCLHEFKKAEFARRVKQQILTKNDISDEVQQIIEKIKLLNLCSDVYENVPKALSNSSSSHSLP